MANTYPCLDYQLVENRHAWISTDIEALVWACLAVSIPATIATCNAMQLMKGGSSKWIHDTFPHLREFAWQDDYAAFSVIKIQRPKLIDHFANQREHHRQELSFQDKLRAMIRLHGIEFDHQGRKAAQGNLASISKF